MTKFTVDLTAVPMSPKLIDRVSQLVHAITGVQLGERQRSMVEARVSRRMTDLGLSDARAYDAYLSAHLAAETDVLVSLLTTHHTFFFREFEQFEYLRDQGLAQIAKALKSSGKKHLRVWTMACSRGQEAYSLAMFLHSHWPRLMPGGTFEIYATDVDPESVVIAKNAVYRIDEIKSVPSSYSGGHWSRGTGEIAKFVRAKDSLRQVCRFAVGNLMSIAAPKPGESYDLIFCRNVFIYFTPEQIRSVTERIVPFLAPHAYFIIGTTESLSGLKLPITNLGTSIYQAASATAAPSAAVASAVSQVPARPSVASAAARPLIRVLVVDDSPTIQAMLKSILTKQEGFDIVGTAMNGAEALKLASQLTFDVMTLDIHMPVKSGVEYLQERRQDRHPPIVMLSSISREDVTLGVKTLELGAVDYVEKPSLGNLAERGGELKTKLRCAVAVHASGQDAATSAAALGLARALERTSQVPRHDRSLRLIFTGIGDRPKLAHLLQSLGRPQPPTVILVDGPEAMVASLAQTLAKFCPLPVKLVEADWGRGDGARLGDAVWVGSASVPPAELARLCRERRSVVLVYDSVATKVLEAAKALGVSPLILEEPLQPSHADQASRQQLATQLLPYTSFLFDSDYVLNKD